MAIPTMPMPAAPEAKPRFWRVIAVALVAPALAIFAGAQTLAMIAEGTRPDQAASLAPWDGSVRAHFAKAAYRGQLEEAASTTAAPALPTTTAPPVAWIGTSALEAYRRQPLTPEALAVIGAGLPEAERGAFWEAAAKTSRRDTLLQGLLLEFHLQTGNLDRSIRILNQILQVRAGQRRGAYAALAQALHDPRSVDTFVDILGPGPDWSNGFLVAAARDQAALENLALVRQRLPDATIEAETDRALVDAFADSGQIALASDLYTRLSSQRPEAMSEWNSEIPPFDWTFADEAGFRAQLVGESEQLRLHIDRGKGGVFASRVFPVRSRTLSIRGAHDLTPQSQADRLDITLTCLGADGPFAQSTLAEGKIALDAAVPPGCGFVEIALSGRAWSDGERIAGTIAPLVISSEP